VTAGAGASVLAGAGASVGVAAGAQAPSNKLNARTKARIRYNERCFIDPP
jgi:hypothetical protein